jgi:TPP-dependent 2-oxoacid decarboxylase
VRLKQKPIVIVLNNNGYGTMRKIRDGRFNVISQWDYGQICNLIGGGSARSATTKGELDAALKSAIAAKELRVIDARIDPDDMSPQLRRMTEELARRRGVKPKTRKQTSK